jgi:hypothetical protein
MLGSHRREQIGNIHTVTPRDTWLVMRIVLL